MFITMTTNPKLLGMICALGAALSFTLNDVGIKFLSGDYALHQIILARATVALIVTLTIIVPLDGGYRNLRTNRLGLHLLRGFTIFLANMTFFAGLATLTIPVATALFFTAPLFITILSIFILKEKVGIQRWFAVGLGLVGVLIILRPGSDAFKFTALLPILAAFAYAMMQMMTRKLGFSERASTMAFYIQLMFIVISTAIGLSIGDGRFSGSGVPAIEFMTRAWVWPSNFDMLILCGIGCASATGGFLISQAYRMCEAGFVAPFEYFAMPIAVLWSVLIFSVWPDTYTWIGSGFIVGAGLFILWRETFHKQPIANIRPMP